VVVPLIVDAEGLHAAGDRVLGQVLEVGGPVRVDRPVGLEVSADGLEERIALAALGHLDGVVDRADADALLGELGQRFEVGVGHVAGSTVAVHNHGGVIEDLFVLGPAVEHDHGADADEGGIEVFGEQDGAGLVLVGAPAVAGLAGDEHDFLGRISGVGGEGEGENGEGHENARELHGQESPSRVMSCTSGEESHGITARVKRNNPTALGVGLCSVLAAGGYPRVCIRGYESRGGRAAGDGGG
jgi:hypothetical protein